MASRPRTPVENSSEFSAEKLQIPASFSGYVAGIINGKSLSTYTVKENAGGSVCVILTYHMERNKENGQPIRRHLGKNASSPNKSGKKHKTPSRRRRDRERFHAFVEKMKARKINSRNPKSHVSAEAELSSPKTVSRITSPSPGTVQSSPPSDLQATVEVSPTVTVTQQESAQASPTVSVTSQEGAKAALETSTDSVSELEPPISMCICSVCRHFDDTDPLLSYYKTCDNCGTPNTEDNPLKPCSRCRFRAYCTKECQKIAWRAHHKAVCTDELGEQARILKNCWLKSRGIWQQHMLEPHKLA